MAQASKTIWPEKPRFSVVYVGSVSDSVASHVVDGVSPCPKVRESSPPTIKGAVCTGLRKLVATPLARM